MTVDDNNRERIKGIQASWVDLVGSDPAAKDLARVLRLPGTVNVKDLYAPDFPIAHIIENESSRMRVYRLQEFEQLTGVDDILDAAKTARTQDKPDDGPQDDVIAEYNRTHHIVDLLTRHNYTLSWDRPDMARLARPGRSKEQSSIVVFKDDGKEHSYHHSSNDILYCDGHTHDAFDVYAQLEHSGDKSAAYEAAKREQGKWTDTRAVNTYTNGAGPSIHIISDAGSMPPLPDHAHIDPEVADGASPWLDAYIGYSRQWSPARLR